MNRGWTSYFLGHALQVSKGSSKRDSDFGIGIRRNQEDPFSTIYRTAFYEPPKFELGRRTTEQESFPPRKAKNRESLDEQAQISVLVICVRVLRGVLATGSI